MTEPSPRRYFARFSEVAAGLAVLVALYVVAEWTLGLSLFRSLLPNEITMRPNAAVCFVLLAIALLLQAHSPAATTARQTLIWGLAGLSALIALATIAENTFGTDLQIDGLLAFHPEVSAPPVDQIRMTRITTWLLLLLSAVLLLLDFKTKEGKRPAEFLALFIALLSLIAIFDRLYNFSLPASVKNTSGAALSTSVSFVLLSLGALWARYDQGLMAVFTSKRPGGVMARRILPAALLLPFFLGWSRYRAEEAGIVGEFGLAAFATVTVLIFSWVVWLSARTLNRLDQRRDDVEASLREAEGRLETVVENIAEGLVVAEADGQVMRWNRAALAMHDFSQVKDMGKSLPDLRKIFELIDQEDQRVPFEQWPLPRLLRGETLKDCEFRVRKIGTAWERRFLFGGSKAIAPNGKSVIFLTIADVTQRHEAEDRLAASEDRVRGILEGLPVAAYTCDAEGLITYFNPKAIEVWGREPRLNDPDDRFCGSLRMYRPDGTPIAHDQSWMAIAVRERRAVHDHEIQIERPDGQLRAVLANSNPLWDMKGRFTGTVHVLADITDEMHVERALRESEERFRELAENVRQVFWLRDAVHGRILYISPEYETMFGLSRESFYADSSSWQAIVHPSDKSRVISERAAAPASGYDIQFRINRADGQERWVRARSFPIRNAAGEIYRAGGIVTDVTESRNAELRLELQHAVTSVLAESAALRPTFRRILEAIAIKFEWEVGEFWTVDVATQRIINTEIWHAASARLTKFTESSRTLAFGQGEDLTGRVWNTGRSLWNEGFSSEPEFARATLALEAGLHGAVGFPIKVGKKTVAVMDFLSAKITKPDPELLAIFEVIGLQLGQFMDRKLIEDQLRQSQKMESVGHLAGGIAHDFNNMLAVVQGRVALIGLHDHLPTEVTESVREISLAAERAANLTRQLLAFGRRQVMQPRDLPLNDAIQDLLKMLRRVLGEDIALRFEAGAGEVSVHADPGMLDQVLLNLAVNSRDAMPKGGSLVIRTALERIDGEVARANTDVSTDNFVCLTISDTGGGIPADVLPKIFEPFFTTKEVGKGSGLGLSTVYGIVKQHHGWITVSSELQKGTSFKIYLPAVTVRREAPKAARAAKPLQGKGETILLVEDEISLRLITQIILERHGYKVIVAENGRQALAAWEKNRDSVNLVLTDIVMPDGMTGQELGAALQAAKPDLKVIYASGYNAAAVGKDFALKEGITFLQKPFELDKLLKALRTSLDET